jgi:hypothetical protein
MRNKPRWLRTADEIQTDRINTALLVIMAVMLVWIIASGGLKEDPDRYTDCGGVAPIHGSASDC